MKIRNILIVGILLLFLCGVASAAYEVKHSDFNKNKNGVMFKNDIDTTKVTVEKNQHNIKVSSGEHSKTKIKISKTDIDAIIGTSDLIKVTHTNDTGVNDWERVVVPNYENGYLELDVEFSTVTITPYNSIVKNYGFETWSSGNTIPTDWTQLGSVVGGEKSTVSNTGSYSYLITGNGVSASRGAIQQTTTLSPGYYTIGASVYVTGVTTGYAKVDLAWTGANSYGISVADNTDGFVWMTKREYIAGTTPTIRVVSFNTVNSGGSFYIDNIMLSPDPSGISATETDTGTNLTQTFSYTPAGVYTDAILITEFEDYDIEARGKTSLSTTIDGSSVTSYIVDGDQIFITTSGLTATEHTVVVNVTYNLPPTMISPADGATVSRDFPPLYANQIFTWEDVGTTCQIQVAEDSTFSNLVYSAETATATATASLAAGTYYWRVRSYDPINLVYGEFPDEYNFIIVSSTGSVTGTGVAGCVYESQGLGDYQVVAGALATVYNNTFSVTKTTGAEGYFQVLDLSAGTYYISVEKSGYEDTGAIPVTVVSSEVTVQNIAISQAQSYYSSTDCAVTVKNHWWSLGGVPDVAYTYYKNDGTTIIGSGTTDSTGSFVMPDIDIGSKYKIVLTVGTTTQTEYIVPSSYKLSFVIVLDSTGATLLSDSQFYDVVNVTVDKLVLNSTAANVNIAWNETTAGMTNVTYQIGQTNTNGTFVLLDEYVYNPASAVDSGNCTFTMSNYLGQSYKIIVEFTESSFGTVEKTYTVTFAGSTIPFVGGKALSYFGVFLVFIVAFQFGKAEHAIGGLMTCGFCWFLWLLDIFTGFGTAVNTTMGAGLAIGTLYAIMTVINESRKGGSI